MRWDRWMCVQMNVPTSLYTHWALVCVCVCRERESSVTRFSNFYNFLDNKFSYLQKLPKGLLTFLGYFGKRFFYLMQRSHWCFLRRMLVCCIRYEEFFACLKCDILLRKTYQCERCGSKNCIGEPFGPLFNLNIWSRWKRPKLFLKAKEKICVASSTSFLPPTRSLHTDDDVDDDDHRTRLLPKTSD